MNEVFKRFDDRVILVNQFASRFEKKLKKYEPEKGIEITRCKSGLCATKKSYRTELQRKTI